MKTKLLSKEELGKCFRSVNDQIYSERVVECLVGIAAHIAAQEEEIERLGELVSQANDLIQCSKEIICEGGQCYAVNKHDADDWQIALQKPAALNQEVKGE